MLVFFLFVFVFFIQCTNYAVVVDAGSTSSKIKVYYWDDLKNVQQAVIPKQFQKMMSLSSYVGKCTNLTYDFFAFVNNILPYIKTDLSTVPFYLGATAGLRLLEPEDAEQLIDCVRYIVKGSFKFKYSDRNIRVISGGEEGIFGWITVQYLEGNFQLTNTAGALDMGGASTQITFIPHHQQILADKKTIKIFSTVVDVYSHSFLKYGLNEAFTLGIIELLKNKTSSEIIHPCLFTRYSREIEGVTFIGSSNVEGCNTFVGKLLELNKHCFYPNRTCSVDGEYLPILPQPNEEKFYAFSGYEYIPLGLKLNPEGLKLSALRETANKFCGNDYEYAKAHSGMEEEYVWNQCFNALYGISLLIEGYKFQPDFDQIQFVAQVGGKDVGWALGSLIYEESMFDSSTDYWKK